MRLVAALPILLVVACGSRDGASSGPRLTRIVTGGGTSAPSAPPAPSAPAPSGPSTLAGTHALISRDVFVGAGSHTAQARHLDVAFDRRSGRWLAAYGVVRGTWQIDARAIDTPGGVAPVVGPDVRCEDAASPPLNNCGNPTVAPATGAGPSRVLVAWQDSRFGNGQGRQDIFGQIFEVPSSGAPRAIGANIDLSPGQATDEWWPNAVYEPASGRWVVTWSDDRDVPARSWEGRAVYGRTLDASGRLSAEFKAADAVAGGQSWVGGAAGGGKVLIAWADIVVQGASCFSGFRARLIDPAASAPSGPIIELLRTGNMPVEPPAVAFDDRSGRFLVVWGERSGPGGIEMFGALVSPSGAIVRPRFPVFRMAAGCGAPRLAYAHATASYILAFHTQHTADAFIVELDPDGAPAGAAVSLSATTPRLGTFFHVPAAVPDRPQAIVLTCEDWLDIEAALFEAPRSIP